MFIVTILSTREKKKKKTRVEITMMPALKKLTIITEGSNTKILLK